MTLCHVVLAFSLTVTVSLCASLCDRRRWCVSKPEEAVHLYVVSKTMEAESSDDEEFEESSGGGDDEEDGDEEEDDDDDDDDDGGDDDDDDE